MTKRDVCVWFCKVVALQGIIGSALVAVRTLFSWQYFGLGNLIYPALSFGLSLFVWFFARGLGTELAAEGEHGPPITSGAEIGTLLLRCAGFWLFLNGSISFGPAILSVAFQYFSRSSPNSVSTIYQNVMFANAVGGLLQSGIGFLLAFTPRICTFLRK